MKSEESICVGTAKRAAIGVGFGYPLLRRVVDERLAPLFEAGEDRFYSGGRSAGC
jgi:hypothetical protein